MKYYAASHMLQIHIFLSFHISLQIISFEENKYIPFNPSQRARRKKRLRHYVGCAMAYNVDIGWAVDQWQGSAHAAWFWWKFSAVLGRTINTWTFQTSTKVNELTTEWNSLRYIEVIAVIPIQSDRVAHRVTSNPESSHEMNCAIN